MNKEYSEALGKNIRYKKEHIRDDLYRLYIKKNEIELLENYLTELEQIKNAKPSEALEDLEELGAHRIEYREGFELGFTKTMPFKSTMEYKTIHQALQKAQEDEKLKVDICEMFGLDNLFPYNDTKAILKELEEYMGRKNQLWVDFMKTSKESKEQKKVLEIIKEKGLDYHSLSAIKQAKNFEEFKELTKNLITKFLDYTKEEFELLKRWSNGK